MIDTDIRVDDEGDVPEIAIGYEDLDLVSGDECLLQDIRNKLYTDIGALFYAPNYGAKVLRYIHAPKDEMTFLNLKQIISIALKQDNRINENSVKIEVTTQDDTFVIKIDFKTIEGNELSLQESI